LHPELELNDKKNPRIEDYGIPSPWVREKAKGHYGCRCFACGQKVQIYQYRITPGMAKTLLMLYRHFYKYPASNPVHVDSFISALGGKDRPKGNKHALLCHWGFLETCESGRKGKGYYRITEDGKKFVLGKIDAPESVVMYNGKCFGESGKKRKFADCLREPFDLEEFLNQNMEG